MLETKLVAAYNHGLTNMLTMYELREDTTGTWRICGMFIGVYVFDQLKMVDPQRCLIARAKVTSEARLMRIPGNSQPWSFTTD
ncbi:hypothetical protein ACN47E_009803 [Coniothyrium glycines]